MRPAGMTRTERESRSKLKPMISWQEFLRATPNLRQQVCGSPGCKCQRGEKHPALVLTRSVNGKVEQLYIPKDQEADVRLWIQRYRDIRDLLEKISGVYWDRLKKKKR
jgi:hypothetical protein